MKPGIKTTEFWLHLVVVFLGAFIAASPHATPLSMAIGGTLSAFSAASWGNDRTQLKKEQMGYEVDEPIALNTPQPPVMLPGLTQHEETTPTN